MKRTQQGPSQTQQDGGQARVGVVLASSILGALLIGIVLVSHEHCVPGGGERRQRSRSPRPNADAVHRIAHAMREPSYAWMIIARPATSADEPPVVTAKPKADTPSAFDVYAIDVHGSVVTEPV